MSHQYAYNQRGLEVRDIDEQNKADSMVYAAAGNLVSRRDRVGNLETFTYDSLNRETRHLVPARTMTLLGSAVTAPDDTVTSAYDVAGNLLTHRNRHGRIVRTYFSNGTIHTEADYPDSTYLPAEAPLVTDSVRMAYNTKGQLDSLLWGAGESEAYRFVWDTLGRRREIIYPYDGMTVTSHYDRLGTLRKLSSTNTSGVTPNRLIFALKQDSVDVMGRVLHQWMDCTGAGSYGGGDVGDPCGDWMPAAATTRYYRTGGIAIQALMNRAGVITTDTFAHNASGDRTSDNSHGLTTTLTTLFYPATSNRVDSTRATLVLGGTSSQYYEYDRDGARRDDYNAIFTNVNGFEYDGAGRMVGYTHNLNTAPNSCSYDPDGRMYQGCGGAPFSILGHNAIRAPQLGWFYVYGPGLDEPLVAIRRVGGNNLEQARLSLVSDGMGQLLSIADSAGTYNNVYENPSTYASGTWATSGITQRAQTFDPRRLATDTNSAISSFRTRQYDPATGSWLQEDHAGLAGGVNLYEYDGNDPNSFGDPFGLQASECPDCATHVIAHPDLGEARPVSPGADPVLAVASLVAGALADAVESVAGAAESRIAGALHTAATVEGETTVEVGSRAEAEAAGERWVGEGARDMIGRDRSVSSPGRVSADATRTYRYPAMKRTGPNAGRAAANLERKVGRKVVGDLHLIFPDEP